MTCAKCRQTQGKAHSFQNIGTMANGTTILFTCPADAYSDDDSVNNFIYYKEHFDSIKGNWIWVVDYREFSNYITVENGKLIVDYLLKYHKDRLVGFYLYKPTTFFSVFLTIVSPFIPESSRRKIHTYSDSVLELIADLQRAGLPSSAGHKLMLHFLKQQA
jgi:hypothetical protein